jgi:competence protein ComEC
MMSRLFCLLILFLCEHPAKDPALGDQDIFIVWNVGQGQGCTLRTAGFCDHFDLGGDRNIIPRIVQVCRGRANRLHLSHWDWDHMNQISALKKAVPVCLWNRPVQDPKPEKAKVLADLSLCPGPAPYQKVFSGWEGPGITSNEGSEVVLTQGSFGVLIPGDAPVSTEWTWAEDPILRETQVLILGHHGSRTSTSEFLLEKLPRLKVAIASARQHKYGHPHPEILSRLQKRKTPVLKTEDWGTIIFLL